jgi:hypothetical protein
MGCGSFGVASILVGLHRVGVVGLADAVKQADASGLTEREELLDLMIERLSADNFIPAGQAEPFRTAIWREYLRPKGQDLRDYYSEIDVTVRGEAGEGRDRFVAALGSALAAFELRPSISFAPEGPEGAHPQLVIAEETILRGLPPTQRGFESAIRKTISGW